MRTTESLILSIFHLIILSFREIKAQNSVSLPACSDYSGFIKTTNILNSSSPIPIQVSINFNSVFNCPAGDAELRVVPKHTPSFTGPEISDETYQGISDTPQFSFFTKAGHFYDNGTASYYKPDGGFCIQSFDNDEITVRICPVDSKCPNEICIPKCCGVHQVLDFWSQSCLPIPQDVTPWLPFIYKTHNAKIPNPKIIYQYSKLPENCSVHKESKGNYSVPFIYSNSLVNYPYDNETFVPKSNIKLFSSSGHGRVQLLTLHFASRQWKVSKVKDFCVDGLYEESSDSKLYTENRNNFVVFYCYDFQDSYNGISHVFYVYPCMVILSLTFLTMTVLVYVLLWDKHGLHGLTILSYSVASLFSYAFIATAQISSLLPDPEVIGLFSRGPICYSIAVLAHFFYLSKFFWLTTMNFNLWLTFAKTKAVKKSSRDLSKFGWYSILAWGLPALLVGAFVGFDEYFRDPTTLVKVPNYATSSCWVARDFRGFYVFLPMACLLSVNMVLLGMTIGILIRARRKSSEAFRGRDTRNQYTMKLFAKLFIIMGGTSMIEFLTWYYDGQEFIPIYILLVESLSYLSPILLFLLFCCNAKIANQMREKYPKFSERVNPLWSFFIKSQSGRDESSSIQSGMTLSVYDKRRTKVFSLKPSISISN